MELDFIPFAQDYYIMNLPKLDSQISKSNYQTLFEFLSYKKKDYAGNQINFAPVIRLFGYDPKSGCRACAHVHGFFPYFYIKVQELIHLFKDKNFVINFINQIHKAYCQTFFQNFTNQYYDKFKIIYNFELVEKFDFYGAHFTKEYFLKLYLYDQQYMTQLVMLLSSGALMNYKFQSYESHISYFMHFHSDNQIYGMSPLQIIDYRMRKKLEIDIEIFQQHNYQFQYSNLYKNTTCQLEFDCQYQHIQNEGFKDQNLCRDIDDMFRSQSKFQIAGMSQRKQKLVQEFYVEFTLTLNKLWQDEERQRQRLSVPHKVQLLLDKTKNKENQSLPNYPSINLLDTDDSVRELFKNHIGDFKNKYQEKVLDIKECFINITICQTFFSGQNEEKEICKKSILDRFREYVTRKKDLFELIKEQGNQDYEYDFDKKEDEYDAVMEVIEEEQINSENQDIDDIIQSQKSEYQNIFETMKQNQQLKDKQKFRKKYKANKGNIKQNIFDICEFCNKNIILCQCNAQIRTQKSIKMIPQYDQAKVYEYNIQPPKVNEVMNNLYKKQQLTVNQYVFYSDPKDLYTHYNINQKKLPYNHTIPQILDNQCIQIPFNRFYSISIQNQGKMPFLYEYDPKNFIQRKIRSQAITFGHTYEFIKQPPTIYEVIQNLKLRQLNKMEKIQTDSIASQSQYYYPTNRSSQNQKIEENDLQDENLFILIFDTFTYKDSELLPDPEFDEIDFIIITYKSLRASRIYKMIIIKNEEVYEEAKTFNMFDRLFVPFDVEIFYVASEINLIKMFQLLVNILDPDFIAAYDLEAKSLYYLASRADFYDYDLLQFLGRGQASYDVLVQLYKFNEFVLHPNENNFIQDIIEKYNKISAHQLETKKQSFDDPVFKRKQKQNKNKVDILQQKKRKMRFNLFIIGRVLINLWRNCATDYKLTDYSYQNVAFELFKIKIPAFSNQTLSQYYKQNRLKVYDYYLTQLKICQDILDIMGLIPRTIEIAKLYGCEYESVGFRGSQFKIESILNRVTKQNEFVLLSATRTQVSMQRILECMPLVIEPPKMLSVDPVIVLDFQSLYPSIMIAYNLCYSTCLGNIKEIFDQGGVKRFGVKLSGIGFKELIDEYGDSLIDQVIVTPNKVAFLKKEVREGVIPKILIEFLMTRIMLKKSSQYYDKYEKLLKSYSFKQLAIKLFMNVMYGYCGASFSGRMPSGDIADSVVEIGRTILNQCVEKIQNTPRWQARVLYGDTDSLFVMLKGRNNEEAFTIGQEIAKECTALYPHPIELKFEKVYSSMFLVAKKRYVGYRLDKLGQNPIFESKGLEIVRRDGCKATQKIMSKSLRMIFDRKDLTELKQYLFKQWAKILNGHYCIQQFILAKEVKLGSYANPLRLPAHAVVATKLIEKDPMKRPKRGERLPYLVIQGTGEAARVKDLVVSVEEYLSNKNYKLNGMYYIQKQINASLGRLFSCFDVDINDWFNNMPREIAKKDEMHNSLQFENASKSKATQYTLNHYFQQNLCMLCHNESKLQICKECCKDGLAVLVLLRSKQNSLQLQQQQINNLCYSCSQIYDAPCMEYSCHILYTKIRNNSQLTNFIKVMERYSGLEEYILDEISIQ